MHPQSIRHEARPTPYLLTRAPRRVRARRLAERAWSVYPPMALMVAVLLLAGGCRNSSADTVTGPARGDRASLAAADHGSTSAAPIWASYPSDLPLAGSAAARGTVRYGKNRLDVVNLSKVPWREAYVWVNRRYAARLTLTKPGEIARIDFRRLRDENGRVFPFDNSRVRIEEIELVLGDERTGVRFGMEP